jgi:hypothetical protein
VTVLTDFASEVKDVDLPAAEARVNELRGKGQGEKFAAAKYRHLVMKRVLARATR